MKPNKLLSNSKKTTCVLILIYTLFSFTQIMATDFYATPMGGGNMDGSDWENAIPGEEIENMINTVMRGGDRLLLDDKDSFFNNLQITIALGGSDMSSPIIIEGVDMGDGYPLIRGTDRSTGVFVYLNAGVSHITIKNLKIEDYKYAIETEEDNTQPNEYIVLEGLDINNVTDGLYLRDFRNSSIKNCEITYHTKRGVRLRTGCRNLEIIDCFTDHNMGNYGDFPSNQFPVGFEVGEGRHDIDSLDQTNIKFIRCEARNCVDDDQSYWNGDGFLVNDKHHNIEFYDCIAYGNADGGWDDKGVGTYYENCISVGNGKNFRNWHSGTYINCLAANPAKYAEDASGGNTNWWFDGQWGDAIVDLYNCTSHNGSISSTGNNVKVNYAENCIFSASDEGARIASGSGNVYTTDNDPEYLNPSPDYEGHPGDAYNSQKYGPEKGYWFTEGENPEIIDISATPSSGDSPLNVVFEVQANDPDGDNSNLSYRWFLKGNQISDKSSFTFTFPIPGEYSIVVFVRDEDYQTISDTIEITVTGNYPPEVDFIEPLNQQFFFEGQTLGITVDAADRDGTIDSLQIYQNSNYLITLFTTPYQYSITGLTPGRYTLKARAFDDAMIFVEDSVEIEVIVPISLYELSWNGYVDLYWEDHLINVPNNFGDHAGYNVYRSTEKGGEYQKINSSVIDTAGYKDNTVVNGTNYYYVVTSENTLGNESGFSNEVNAMPQVSVNLDCTDDAHVRNGKYGDENYGSDTLLVVKTEGEDWQRFTYLRFDLSTIGSFSKASLRLKSTDAKANFHSVKCYLAENDTWTEEDITWDNKPDTSSFIEITKVPGSQSWIDFDVTDEVQARVLADKHISFVLVKLEPGNPGYSFHSKEASSKSDHPLLFIAPNDTTNYTITAGSGYGGSINPHGEIRVYKGFNEYFHIEPEEGYRIEEVSVDGNSQGAISEYSFLDVSQDHTISASFVEIPTYNITAISGEGGTINPVGETTVYEGDSLQFIIEPDSDYRIHDLLLDGISIGVFSEYTLSDINSSHVIEVLFTPITGFRGNKPDYEFYIYPNPARDRISFSTSHNQFDVEIYSMEGNLIKFFPDVSNGSIISTRGICDKGMYIIKVLTEDRVEIKRLILQD